MCLRLCGKNKGKWIKVKIVNKSPFYWGVGITCTLVFVYSFGTNVDHASTWGKDINAYSLLGKSLFLAPGILLILNGLFPASALGKIGGFIFDLFSWVLRETKK